jgi:hypothetical protein
MPERRSELSDEAELELLSKLGQDVFGLRFENIVHRGFERNMMGVRSRNVSFSRRLDSRTFFLRDSEYSAGSSENTFRGTAEEHFQICHTILKKLQIPESEVFNEILVKEQTQVAGIDPASGKVTKEPVKEGKYFARLLRQLDGLPVWDSNMILSLAEKGRIGYLQLHWPEIPSLVLREAQRLAHKVSTDWKPRSQSGGAIEAIEAGIIHSPAIGFFMDICAAIRVVYRTNSEQHRQKPMYFYDRHGEEIPIPRQITLPEQEPDRRRREPVS